MVFRQIRKLLFGAALLIAAPLLLAAENAVAAEDSAQELIPLPQPTIEEILIIGQKTARALRFEIRDSEYQIYGMLNDLIQIEEFKTECRLRDNAGSFIKEHICEPAFLTEARREATQQALLEAGDEELAGGGQSYLYFDALKSAALNGRDLRVQLAPMYDEYKNMIDKLAAENPDLAEAIMELYYLNEEQKKRKASWWGNLFGRD